MTFKINIRWFVLRSFLFLVCTLVAGCSDKAEETQPQPSQLVIGSQFDIGGSVDPRQGLGGPCRAPKLLIYETPVYFDENYQMQPLLFTAWTPADDAKTWTVHLRKGVRFTDGTPLSADALIFSIRYMASPGSHLADIGEMKAIDDHTVRLTLNTPDAVFIHTLSSLPIMSPSCVDQNGHFIQPVGTGPFRFVEYTQGRQLVYQRNDDYWGPKPGVEKVVFKFIPDFNTRSLALESGEIDIADYLPAEILKTLEADPRFTVARKTPSPCPNWIGLNTNRPPFDDVRVRRAVNYAVDVQAIVDRLINAILPGLAVPATRGPHSQPLFADIVHPDLKWYGYDPVAARRLLAEAGWQDSDGDGILDKEGASLKVELISSLLYAEGTEIAEAVQSQLAAVGMDVRVRVLESGARFQAYREKRYDMIELAGICPHNDPSPWYEYYFHSKKQRAYCVIENPAIDAGIDRLATTVDEEDRRLVLYQLQALLEETAPGIFLYIQKGAMAFRSDLKGFKTHCGMSGAFSYARFVH
ncbi:ABC transporter substrate-binding protein [Desulfosarcina ovata]|uniref:ABC transporter substrate-binding protein n=1 Tax=Desulfosarcina ovata subsp. ovata TaxID=2752305 RepID=A0A5K8A9M3_9BACT|nr:ABC transporter substrate-binding protein [Desulfosarcina ovata]BBO89158.1 ABC transporter substrate-binding protein [Desulfosarcina ovata subsp. ovata]